MSQATGSCHCGNIKFAATILDEPPSRCDCTFCTMRGALVYSCPYGQLHLKESKTLGKYQFGTMTAEHYFCTNCGIYTHHRCRSDPNIYSVNASCIGRSPYPTQKVAIYDGQNHVNDGYEDRIVGYLGFERCQ